MCHSYPQSLNMCVLIANDKRHCKQNIKTVDVNSSEAESTGCVLLSAAALKAVSMELWTPYKASSSVAATMYHTRQTNLWQGNSYPFTLQTTLEKLK